MTFCSDKFKAGRLKCFQKEWKKLTNDPMILDIVKNCHFQFVDNKIPVQNVLRQYQFNARDTELIDKEIKKLLEEGVIVKVDYCSDQFLSPIFTRPKKDTSEVRLILNLNKLNSFLPYCHFKMENFENALQLITKDMYMCSIDIRKAYYSMPLAEEQQHLFRFEWREDIFQFTCMPNGVGPGPRLFTKLMKPVYSKLRSEGHISSGFIDDSLLCGVTYQKCVENVKISSELLTSLGFMLNLEKSVLVPTQQICHLGNIIDSNKMMVFLPQDKKDKIKSECQKLYVKDYAQIRAVARVIGLLVSSFSAVEVGKLHYRELEKSKTVALRCNKGNFDATMKITLKMKSDLSWWIKNIQTQLRKIRRENPEVVIITDSSRSGWGAVLGETKIGGHWTKLESMYHINALEMKAVYLAVQAFLPWITGKYVKIMSDSSTAVSYINNFGGVKSVACNEIAKQIWNYCLENDWLLCAYIPGKENPADVPSRRFKDHLEWELKQDVFEQICKHWEYPNIDLFASRLNKKVQTFCSWKPEPEASFIDAFSIDWKEFELCYCFPCFSMIGRCIQKVKNDRARVILVVPLWTTQIWFPVLMSLLVDHPRILPAAEKILQLPHKEGTHPLAKQMVLITCKVSGNGSEIEAFQNQLPEFLWRHGEHLQNVNTKSILSDGFSSVINGKLIKFMFL